MSSTTTQPMTADEFLKRYVDHRWVELVDGQVVSLPMPGAKHGEVCVNAGSIIRDFVKRHRLGRVASNDVFVVTRKDPDGCRGADVLYVSYSRLPADIPTPKGAITPPLELVVEVRSPTDTVAGMTRKAEEYVAAGVQVVLVLDPDVESVAVFRANENPHRLHNGDELTLPDVLPGFSTRVKAFFE